MSKGGYKIISFEGFSPLTSGTEVTIDGVYDSIEGNTKAVLITDLAVSTTEYPDFFTMFLSVESVFTSVNELPNGDTLTIAVDSDDGVTVTVTTPTQFKRVNKKNGDDNK